jgi:beta-glucosidase-like glycosyl hydrolase
VQVGAQSAVLLKNDDGVLPLARDATIALVGSACGASHEIDVESAASWNVGDYYVVGGSGRVVSDKTVSIKAALERRGVQLRVSATDRIEDAVLAAHDADVVLA